MKIIELATISDPRHPAANRRALRIGTSADGRPLYQFELGWEPSTAYVLSINGNWIEARAEFPAGPVEEGVDPLSEVLEIPVETETASTEEPVT